MLIDRAGLCKACDLPVSVLMFFTICSHVIDEMTNGAAARAIVRILIGLSIVE